MSKFSSNFHLLVHLLGGEVLRGRGREGMIDGEGCTFPFLQPRFRLLKNSFFFLNSTTITVPRQEERKKRDSVVPVVCFAAITSHRRQQPSRPSRAQNRKWPFLPSVFFSSKSSPPNLLFAPPTTSLFSLPRPTNGENMKELFVLSSKMAKSKRRKR